MDFTSRGFWQVFNKQDLARVFQARNSEVAHPDRQVNAVLVQKEITMNGPAPWQGVS
jgi:hypothetical protein